jgi:hypothetical protein
MKFLPLRDFDDVTGALNFKTLDLSVTGGCDLYTTKAAGTDKKLYRNIETSLESQYESLLRLSASVSPPIDEEFGVSSINLSRSSPFGPLSQVSSRRTFAYLIATLNASHPDYDFSRNLRPSDFKQERSLKAVMNNIDSTLYNLRPGSGMTLQVPTPTSMASTPATSQTWGPHMWSMIDKEMTLNECTVYCWAPPDDPFDDEDASIWSLNYFFFNKDRKRVAYLYVRGVPVVTHSPRQRMGMAKRSASGYDLGANKRARYWLGDKAANVTNEETDTMWDTNEVDSEEFDNGFEEGEEFYDDYHNEADDESDYHNEADDESDEQSYKGPVRGVSEDIMGSMEMDY